MFKYNDKEIAEIIRNSYIIIDSREKKNDHITSYFERKGIPWCNEKLDYCDYSMKIHLDNDKWLYLTDVISIERKRNLEEISGNLTKNRERFNDEFLRSKGKIYLLIENANYEDIEMGNYNTQFNKNSFRASLDAFEQRYNLHIHYQKDDKVSGYFIYRTLIAALKEELKKGTIKI